MQTIGIRLAELRKEKGLTQAELAKKLNVKRETVNQWENNVRDLKTQYTISLAKEFGVSADYILGITPNVKTTDTTVKEICAYTGLSEETVKAMHKNPYTFVGKLTSDMQKHIGKLFDIQGKGEKK